MHIKTFSLDIMYHEGQIQYISPTRLANKYVTTNKLILIIIYLLSLPSFLIILIYIFKIIKYANKKNVHFRTSLRQNKFMTSLYPIILLSL